jgi:glycosyltransferase involved in cell wall biosynthesis
MADKIVGMMFAKNEADVLPFTIAAALPHVHSLFIADDGSVDGSWEIMKYFKHAYPDKVEHVQQKPTKGDQGQRGQMLDLIRARYKAENTWVQTIEADIILGTDNLREIIRIYNKEDVAVDWECINAARRDWDSVHSLYPHWPDHIQRIMPELHHLEPFKAYTYRPLPKLFFEPHWRPWPHGFSYYYTPGWKSTRTERLGERPFALHYGYRGPTHLMYKRRLYNLPLVDPKNGWDYRTVEDLTRTCPYFSGAYNSAKNAHLTALDAWNNR